jgi:hypothetical protein
VHLAPATCGRIRDDIFHAIIVDDTKALTLAGWKNVEGRNGRSSPILPSQGNLPVQATQATGLPCSPLKKLYIKLATLNSPSTISESLFQEALSCEIK